MADVFVVGQVVPLRFYVRDDDGQPAAAGSATLTVTKPDASSTSPGLTNPDLGQYDADYVPATAGRYVAVAVFGTPNAGTAVRVFDVVSTTLAIVTLADVQAYLGDVSWTGPEIQTALDAERAAQAKTCRIDDYGHDLREALCRRVARNLAARAVPVAQFTSFEGGGGTSVRVPMTDPEVARLEGPYLKVVLG